MINTGLAGRILADLADTTTLPINIFAIVNAYNVKVYYDGDLAEALPRCVEGIYLPNPVPAVILNKSCDVVKRKFALAHELYHHLDYSLSPTKNAARFSGVVDSRAEQAANLFADELIMPEAAVRRLMAKGKDRYALKSLFGVRDEDITRRLTQLGINPPGRIIGHVNTQAVRKQIPGQGICRA